MTYFDTLGSIVLITMNLGVYILAAYFFKNYCLDGGGHWNPGYVFDANESLLGGILFGILGIFITFFLVGFFNGWT